MTCSVSIGVELSILCVKCGRDRDVELPDAPESTSCTVFKTEEALYIRTAEACVCGSHSVKTAIACQAAE